MTPSGIELATSRFVAQNLNHCATAVPLSRITNNNNNNNNNNNKYKAEIINIAEYLNRNYKEDQFVKIIKNHESTQPNMNSIIKSAAKFIEELSQLYGKSGTK
jgi:hypothetical protein